MPRTIEDCLLNYDAVTRGAWVTHPRFGFQWCIGSTRDPAFRKRRDELRRPHAALLAGAPQSEEAQKILEETVTRAFCETLLHGWRGMFHRVNGAAVPLEFSAEVAVELLSKTSAVHLREWAINEAADDERVMAAAGELDAGNSERGSVGA
jgi:hypothetical protein